jgi:hypothetical protein
MFVMAKLFIALRFRHDLAVMIQDRPQQTLRNSSLYPDNFQSEPQPKS